jgi:hypothetical protein
MQAFSFKGEGKGREGKGRGWDGMGEERREEKRRERRVLMGARSESPLTSAPFKDGCYVNRISFFIVF